MLPSFTVFNREISMYGVMVAVGALACLLFERLAVRRARRETGLTIQQEGDLELAVVYGLLGCVVGAKVLYLLTIIPQLSAALSVGFLRFVGVCFSGGFVFYGGLFGWLLAVWLYAKIAKSDLERLLDLLAPMPALFHGFGRIGCFFAGCCYGRPTDSFLGVVFHYSDIAPAGVPLLPVQLFETVAEFILFGLMAGPFRKRSGVWRMRFHLLAYSAFRFVIEFFRGDALRGFIGPLSTSQTIALVTALVVLLRIFLPRRKAGQAGAVS